MFPTMTSEGRFNLILEDGPFPLADSGFGDKVFSTGASTVVGEFEVSETFATLRYSVC